MGAKERAKDRPRAALLLAGVLVAAPDTSWLFSQRTPSSSSSSWQSGSSSTKGAASCSSQGRILAKRAAESGDRRRKNDSRQHKCNTRTGGRNCSSTSRDEEGGRLWGSMHGDDVGGEENVRTSTRNHRPRGESCGSETCTRPDAEDEESSRLRRTRLEGDATWGQWLGSRLLHLFDASAEGTGSSIEDEIAMGTSRSQFGGIVFAAAQSAPERLVDEPLKPPSEIQREIAEANDVEASRGAAAEVEHSTGPNGEQAERQTLVGEEKTARTRRLAEQQRPEDKGKQAAERSTATSGGTAHQKKTGKKHRKLGPDENELEVLEPTVSDAPRVEIPSTPVVDGTPDFEIVSTGGESIPRMLERSPLAIEDETIMHIRDPTARTSQAFQQYKKQREPLERAARERRLRQHMRDSDRSAKDGFAEDQEDFESTEDLVETTLNDDPAYEDITFGDGSALRFPKHEPRAKRMLSEIRSALPDRSPNWRNVTHVPRKVVDLEDYSTRHIDTSDRRYRKSKFSHARRALQMPGGLGTDNTFTTMIYRNPEQCERNACIPNSETNCKDHLPGFYLKERGCAKAADGGTQICTDCQYPAGLGQPTICQCEKVPFSTIVRYNEACDSSRVCERGECFRPCEFFLHVSTCPLERCMWNTTALNCVDIPDSLVYLEWAPLVAGAEATEGVRGPIILQALSPTIFPLTFDKFVHMASTYLIKGRPITDYVTLVEFFQRLELNFDGFLTAAEVDSKLTKTLMELEAEAERKEQERTVEQLTSLQNARQLQIVGNVAAHQQQSISPDSCLQEVPPQFYCSILVMCVADCSMCGWKSVGDTEFFICVAPSPTSCREAGQKYCGADEKCHTLCADCVGRPILDYSQNACLSPWWYSTPSMDTSTWICRHRRKVGRSCIHDQDCIYGLHKCLAARTTAGTKRQCMPLRPYEETHICKSHLDCPHVDYFCPDDPTGNDPFWIKYCRMQLGEGRKCTSDLECQSDMLCNTIEVPAPRCRRLFSMPLGWRAKEDRLCVTGWTNKNRVCTYPAKSKRVGLACTSNADCTTTDPTGRTGTCYCKDWWEDKNSKYCLPVAGDMLNHLQAVRDLEFFKATSCGKFYTDEECLEEYTASMVPLRDRVEGETQCLSSGPYLPATSCNLGDGGGKYIDYCLRSGQHSVKDEFSKVGLLSGSAFSKGPTALVVLFSIVAAMLPFSTASRGPSRV
ncbi:unnamed protein product [Amoebophrya sp. A25]|nr:unnamed protein product [Amoebophrya sp. A25]|eukprot:GSA25T00025157001.1